MTTAEILRAARALIDTPDKWLHEGGASGRDGDRRCVGAAIYDAGDGQVPFSCYEDHPVWGTFKRANGLLGRPLPAWNDEPERTHAEVLDAFDRAIAASEAA